MKITFKTIDAYKVTYNGKSKHSMKICLNPYLQIKPGDKIYQAKLDDGCILLIPENLKDKYNKEKI